MKPPSIPGHVSILASAGSGKTYQLTTRYLRLLDLCEEPERIIALTFTRTAASGFFLKIINRLRAAATDPAKAEALAAEMERPADQARFRDLLRRLLEQMHRLNLMTLDSFFFRLVNSFPLELGLSGSLQLLDETAAPLAKEEVRDRLIHQEDALKEEIEQFAQAFQQATFGRDERSVGETLSQFVDDLHDLYGEAPEAFRWGDRDTIWPEGCPWSQGEIKWDEESAEMEAAIPSDWGKSQQDAFFTLGENLREYPRHRLPKKLGTAFLRLLEIWPDLQAGKGSLKIGRGKNNTVNLPPAFARLLFRLVAGVMDDQLTRACATTDGAHRLLAHYDEAYAEAVRRPGKLSFADLTRLLARPGDFMPWGKGDGAIRETLEYRLDGKLDHWLFDEFQDTSRQQWRVVANLVDEVLQDPSGQRSFFCVGDTKQCLYLWRQGDDRLFHEIREHYGRGPDGLQFAALDQSWRSAPAILDLVNALFSDVGMITELFSPEIALRWEKSWQPHTPSPATRNLGGFSGWLPAPPEEEYDPYATVLELLREIQPLEKGWTVSVLVRKNAEATALTDYLRTNGGPPVFSGSAIQPLSDNQLGVILRELLQRAAHPGDQRADGFLQWLPPLQGETISPRRWAARLREEIHDEGYARALRLTGQRLLPLFDDPDGFYRRRLQLLEEAALLFEQEEIRHIDAFIRFLEGFRSSEFAGEGAVVVQTIHKAKGLEYDMVIYLDSETTTALKMPAVPTPLRGDGGEVEWILKPLFGEGMEADPPLARLVSQEKSQAGFEALCRLYVALTRAKRGLYIVSTKSGTPHQGSLAKFLQTQLQNNPSGMAPVTLAGLPTAWQIGDPQWHEEKSVASAGQAPGVAEAEPPPPAAAPPRPHLQRALPSAAKDDAIHLESFFALDTQALDFGSVIHRAFEELAWWPNNPVEQKVQIETWRQTFGERVGHTMEKALADPEVRALLTQPEGREVILWREKSFSWVDGDRLYRGVFDRVVLLGPPGSPPEEAGIIDFKTDRISGPEDLDRAVEKHRPQLTIYRQALSAITGIPVDRIATTLLFTDLPGAVTRMRDEG